MGGNRLYSFVTLCAVQLCSCRFSLLTTERTEVHRGTPTSTRAGGVRYSANSHIAGPLRELRPVTGGRMRILCRYKCLYHIAPSADRPFVAARRDHGTPA